MYGSRFGRSLLKYYRYARSHRRFQSGAAATDAAVKPPLLNTPRSVFIGLVTLGGGLFVWDALSKAQERDIVAVETQRRMAMPPAPLPLDITPEQYQELLYRPFFVSGELLHDRELRLTAQFYKRSIGAHIITPLKRYEDGSIVLVNRGWVPPELIKPTARAEAQVTGPVTILGNLSPGEQPGGPQLENKPIVSLRNQIEKNIWYWKELDAMAAVTGAKPILLDVQADPPNPGGFPIGGQASFPIHNPFRARAAIVGGLSSLLVLGTVFIGRIFPRFAVKAQQPLVAKVWSPKPPPSSPLSK